MIALSGLEPRQHYVTAEGALELQQLLRDLKQSRLKLAEEVRIIASQTGGNALDESVQAINHARANELNEQIAVLKYIIATAKIITKPATNHRVQLGSQVVLEVSGTQRTYSIVGSLEVDPSQGKISNESPLGLSLLGKQVKDCIEILVRGQRLQAVIAQIR